MLKVINSIRNDVEGSNGKCESRCNKTAGAEKVYEKKEYIILKVKKGYIVYNTKKEFESRIIAVSMMLVSFLIIVFIARITSQSNSCGSSRCHTGSRINLFSVFLNDGFRCHDGLHCRDSSGACPRAGEHPWRLHGL